MRYRDNDPGARRCRVLHRPLMQVFGEMLAGARDSTAWPQVDMKWMRRACLRPLALVAVLWLFAVVAHAQIIDTVDVRAQGDDAVIRIKFSVLIQYLRHVPADRGTAVRIFFQITAANDSSAGIVEEERRAQPSKLLPRFRVIYPSQRPGVQRYIDVVFDQAVDFRVQPEGNSTILVSVPLAAPPEKPQESKPAAPAATATPAERKPVAPPTPIEPTPVAPAPAAEPKPAAPVPPTAPTEPKPAAPPAPPEAKPATPVAPSEPAATAPTPPRPLALPPPTATTGPRTEVDKQAATDVAEGRAALASGSYDKAVLAFNRALNLPPNPYSQEAQELVGVARERNGEFAKALVEYELYLKLYPDGPGAARVREYLSALPTPSEPMGGPMGAEPAIAKPAFNYWGSLSQYYYGGQSQITNARTITDPATNATVLDTAKISATDQSQLVNNIDLTARYRDGNWDSRMVVREQFAANFLSNGSNQNYLNALYGETRYLPKQLMARVGRQSSTSGGVLGLFDGAVGSWGFLPNYRVNAVIGQPVDNPFNTTSTFYGASLDVDRMGDRFGGNAFGIWQVAASQTDRLGVGGELRYFDTERNVYSMLDYDPIFRAVNIGTVQGTWQFPSLTSINLLLDYRRQPTLQLTNALVAYPGTSLSTLIQQQGVDATRSQAKALTPVTKQTLFGVTQQLSAQWQLGLDVRWSSLSATPAFQGLPGTPSSGSVWTFTGQAIGSGLTQLQDILVVNVGYLTSNQLRAQNAGVDYRFVPLANLTLEPMFAWYHQTDNLGTRITRLSPGLRASYRILNQFSLEGQFNLERTTTEGDMIDDTIQRYFYYLGWRWDF